jgi:hypothetical protein
VPDSLARRFEEGVAIDQQNIWSLVRFTISKVCRRLQASTLIQAAVVRASNWNQRRQTLLGKEATKKLADVSIAAVLHLLCGRVTWPRGF